MMSFASYFSQRNPQKKIKINETYEGFIEGRKSHFSIHFCSFVVACRCRFLSFYSFTDIYFFFSTNDLQAFKL